MPSDIAAAIPAVAARIRRATADIGAGDAEEGGSAFRIPGAVPPSCPPFRPHPARERRSISVACRNHRPATTATSDQKTCPIFPQDPSNLPWHRLQHGLMIVTSPLVPFRVTH
ncbi:hypothetical protein ACFFP0_21430 [Rhizobium puerariae]|uniref:Uncharacterized protein n=1 Tax=Rhizobium puerariae TaxID=1585791 RepID=A0ABV6ALC2_9HYPH